MDPREEANRRLADKGEVVYDLPSILRRRGWELRENLRQITGTEDLEDWLTRPENLEMLLMALPAADYALFDRASASPFYQEKGLDLPMHSGLIGFCLMQPYLVGEELYLVVPTELRALWRDLKKTDFPRRKQLHDTLDAYAAAAVKLYGVLPLEDFGELLKKRAALAFDPEAEEMLRGLADGAAYVIENGLLLVPGLSPEGAEAYLAASAEFPRYCPSHEKLLHLGDGDYYDVFRELELWRLEAEDSFRSAGDPEAEQHAAAFADSLYAMLRMELSDTTHGEIFEAFGLAPDEERVRRIKDQVRLWCLGGSTPAELLAAIEQHKWKPRVNAPCPCGSGKKYKKCHGAG